MRFQYLPHRRFPSAWPVSQCKHNHTEHKPRLEHDYHAIHSQPAVKIQKQFGHSFLKLLCHNSSSTAPAGATVIELFFSLSSQHRPTNSFHNYCFLSTIHITFRTRFYTPYSLSHFKLKLILWINTSNPFSSQSLLLQTSTDSFINSVLFSSLLVVII